MLNWTGKRKIKNIVITSITIWKIETFFRYDFNSFFSFFEEIKNTGINVTDEKDVKKAYELILKKYFNK